MKSVLKKDFQGYMPPTRLYHY